MQKINFRQEQAQETRRRLMDAALCMFGENGYAGTQVRAITRSVGMSDGLLYHYFPGGKAELFEAVIRENAERILGEFDWLSEELVQLPIVEVLERMYRDISAALTAHLAEIRIFLREKELCGLVDPERLRGSLERELDRLPAFLAERAARGEIRQMDFEAAAFVLSSLFVNHFVVMIMGITPGALSDDAHRARVFEHLIGLWRA